MNGEDAEGEEETEGEAGKGGKESRVPGRESRGKGRKTEERAHAEHQRTGERQEKGETDGRVLKWSLGQMVRWSIEGGVGRDGIVRGL